MKIKKDETANEYLKRLQITRYPFTPLVNYHDAAEAVRIAKREKIVPFEIGLLEKVVERAWDEESKFNKAIFGKELELKDSICQGLCRRIRAMIKDVFDEVYEIEFRVGKKTHLALVVINDNNKFIVDGTIRQFHKHRFERRTVFRASEYPLKLIKLKEWKERIGF